MFCVRRLKPAVRLMIPMLFLAACGPDPAVTAVQQTMMRDVAGTGGVGGRQDLPVAEFVQDEFLGAEPSIGWTSGPFPKDSADAALVSVVAQVTSSQAGFPKVSVRFKYDPATQKVTYRDTLAGKKPLVGKGDRPVALASAYETVKTGIQAKAIAKAEEKAKKKAAAELKAQEKKTKAGSDDAT